MDFVLNRINPSQAYAQALFALLIKAINFMLAVRISKPTITNLPLHSRDREEASDVRSLYLLAFTMEWHAGSS